MTQYPEPTQVEFVRYNQWANQQLLGICLKLDEGLLTAKIPGGYGTILETFSHLLRAEAGFIKRIDGHGPQPLFKWEDGPTLAQLADFASTVSTAFIEMLQRVPPTQNVHEEDANEGWRFDYQARTIFMSVVYHGVAHRTDITTFLNSRGIELPELDVWGYLAAQPERFGAKMWRESGSKPKT